MFEPIRGSWRVRVGRGCVFCEMMVVMVMRALFVCMELFLAFPAVIRCLLPPGS
jgi:hypothetical protein